MNDDTVMSKFLEEKFCRHCLTRREKETAALLVEGLTNEKIAEHLVISIATAKSYVTNIYRKFNVKSRAEFMAKIIKDKNLLFSQNSPGN